MKSILHYPKNKISLSELQEYYKLQTYAELVSIVEELQDKGQITPIKNSKGNGKKPTLYNMYRILRKIEVDTSYVDELLYLSNKLMNDYYLKNPSIYVNDRIYVQQINQYILQIGDEKPAPASYNERSFEIFKREKFLSKEGGLRILKNLGISIEDLNIYETTEPLSYYSNEKEVPQTILFIENKDTFYSMRRHLLQGNKTILSERIGTLIYGGGKSVYRSILDFDLCVEPYMNHEQNRFLYFGDLDYEGILIYEKLHELWGTNRRIIPFAKAYELMLNKAEGITLPETKENQNRNCGIVFFDEFSDETVCKMQGILKQDRYIPQEILQEKDF